MLVLSRKEGQCLVIDHPRHGPIVVQVVDICAGRVRLGVTAPREVPIVRGEVLEQKAEGSRQ